MDFSRVDRRFYEDREIDWNRSFKNLIRPVERGRGRTSVYASFKKIER